MKQKIKLLLAIATMFSITSFAHSQDVGCKCGNQCKCGENNGTGMCKCGVGCQCARMHSHPMQMTHDNVFLLMMDSMMTAMDAAPLDASAEGNFLRQMIPHHQGAIEMAKYEIANGKNKQMIQLAKSILAEQQGEIQEMEALLTLYPFVQNQAPTTDYKKSMDDAMMKMMAATPSDKALQGKSVDCAFAMVMLPHHQAAVDMSTALLKLVPTGQVATYAARIISDQQIEIQQMDEFIKQNCKE